MAYSLCSARLLRRVACVNGMVAGYDLVVVGSDQVWNLSMSKDQVPGYFLGETVEKKIPVIGYALSAGDHPQNDADYVILRAAARKRFTSISFREKSFKDALRVDGPVLCDPTFLLNREDYRMIEYEKTLVRGDYVFAYIVRDAQSVLPIARCIADKMGCRLVVADTYRDGNSAPCSIKNDCWVLTPDKMLAYIRDAKYVIACSFHGCAISLLYKKQFVSLVGADEGYSRPNGRQQDLLTALGIIDRMMSISAGVEEIMAELEKPYVISEKLEDMRHRSLQWLEINLRGI